MSSTALSVNTCQLELYFVGNISFILGWGDKILQWKRSFRLSDNCLSPTGPQLHSNDSFTTRLCV